MTYEQLGAQFFPHLVHSAELMRRINEAHLREPADVREERWRSNPFLFPHPPIKTKNK